MGTFTRRGTLRRRVAGAGIAVLAVAGSAAVVLPATIQPASAALGGLTAFEIDGDTVGPNDWVTAGGVPYPNTTVVADTNYTQVPPSIPTEVSGATTPPYLANCPSINTDSAFKGGTDIADPDWTDDTVTQSVVDKGDICLSMFASDVVNPGAGVDPAKVGHIVAYAGFARRTVNGDVTVYFLFTSPNSTNPNIRVAGDVVIQVDYNGSGDPTNTDYAVWSGTGTPTLSAFQNVPAGVIEVSPIQYFGEIAVDLTALGLAQNAYQNITSYSQCGVVSTGRMITRTGNAQNASLKDDGLPGAVAANLCGNLVLKKQLTVADPTGANTFPVSITPPAGVTLRTTSVNLQVPASSTLPGGTTTDANTAPLPVTGNPISMQVPARATGGYVIDEAVSARWQWVSTTCVNDKGTGSTGDDVTFSATDPSAAIGILAKETVTCTILNSPRPVSIAVTKALDPSSAPGTGASWSISATGPTTPSAQSIGKGQTATFNSLANGVYTLTETPATGIQNSVAYRALSWQCTIGGATSPAVVQPVSVGNTTNLSLAPGDAATCTVTNQVVPAPQLTMTKQASPTSFDEPAGTVTYSVGVTNPGTTPVTVTSLTDAVTLDGSPVGNLTINADGGTLAGVGATVTANNCDTNVFNQVVAGGATLNCTFTVSYTGRNGDQVIADTVAAVGTDAFGRTVNASANASVTVNDVLPTISVDKQNVTLQVVANLTAQVTYSLRVTNTSVEPVTVQSITDDLTLGGNPFGSFDILQTGGGVVSTQCAALFSPGSTVIQPGQSIPAAGDPACQFTISVDPDELVAGQVLTNSITVTATDDDGNQAVDDDPASQTVLADLPSLIVFKTDNGFEIPEPGSAVTYTVQVGNTSTTRTVTLNAFGDAIDIAGTPIAGSPFDLTAPAGAVVTGPISCGSLVLQPAVGALDAQGFPTNAAAKTTCTFTVYLPADFPVSYHDVVTVSGTDDLNQPVSASNEANTPALDVLPDISVTKDADVASVPETGGTVTYTVTVTNASPEEFFLTGLSDSVFGPLTIADDSTCDLPQPIAGNGSYSCTFTGDISGNGGTSHLNVVTATGQDDEENVVTATDDAEVLFTPVPPTVTVVKDVVSGSPVPEFGGPVTYEVTVTNTGTEPVTLTDLVDVRNGDTANPVDLTTLGCAVNALILPGDSYSCQFTVDVPPASQATSALTQVEADQITATVADDDTPPSVVDVPSNEVEVPYSNVPPTVVITKTDSGDVSEPGGDVTYTLVIENTSQEPVTITSLGDEITYSGEAALPLVNLLQASDGPMSGSTCTAAVIPVGGSVTCTFVVTLDGEPTVVDDTATVVVTDNEGSTGTASDDERTAITDVAPHAGIEKTADPTIVDEPGDDVTFTVTATNDSPSGEDIKVFTVVDDVYGDLTTECLGDPVVPKVVPFGVPTTICTFVRPVTGNAGDVHVDTVTVTYADNELEQQLAGDPSTVLPSAEDDATVTIADVLPQVIVSKDALPTSVDELGGSVTFTFRVDNPGVEPVTITSLDDDVFGDLFAASASCAALDGAVIDPGDTATCTYTTDLSGSPADPHTNTVTVAVEDDEGNEATDDDSETVDFDDNLPSVSILKTPSPTAVSELGGSVTFTFSVTNETAEPVTVTSLDDDVFGDLTTLAGSTCGSITALAGDETKTCTYTTTLSGSPDTPHTNTVTVTVEDDEGNEATDSDDATVDFDDNLPSVSIVKTANPTAVPETGGSVTFTFSVTNETAEPVTVTSLDDDQFGDLSLLGTCGSITALAGDETKTCTYTTTLSGVPGTPHVNTATVTVEDDEGNEATDSDSETVTFGNVPPTVDVVKTANPTSVSELGGSVTFTFEITNTSQEPVTLTSLDDDVFGDLLTVAGSDCGSITSIAAGATVTCSYTTTLSGSPSTPHTNTVTVVVTDRQGSTGTDSDSEIVTFADNLPSVSITKTPNPTSVDETGGSVTFTFAVTNGTAEPVTVTSLDDDVFGDLTTLAGSTCGSITALAANETKTCTYTTTLSGEAGDSHVNVVTVVVADDDGNSDEATAEATVDFDDVLPDVTLDKTANPTSVPESGADVTFTFTITNNTDEDVFVSSLDDSAFGDLLADESSDCSDLDVVPGGGSVSCTYTAFIDGSDYPVHYNEATVVVYDNEENSDEATDDEFVDVVDAVPVMTITKTPSVSSLVEPGGPVTFTVVATNSSPSGEDVWVTSLVDSDFGDLTVECLGSEFPQVTVTTESPVTLCTFTRTVTVSPTTPHNNVVTATYYDEAAWQSESDGYEASDDATVTGIARTIVVTAEPACSADTPYLKYRIVANFQPTNGPTVTFKPVASNPDQRTYPVTAPNLFVAQQDGTWVQDVYGNQANWLLWPGAVVTNGVTTDWPGWDEQANGTWVENPGDTGGNLRPEAFVTVSVNPTADSAVIYPPASPNCNPNPPAEFQVVKTGEATLVPGSTFTYTLKITNVGGPAVSNIAVNDPLPAPLTYASHDIQSATVPDSACSGSGSSFTCSLPPTAVPGGGGSLTITLVVNVPANIAPGSYRNVVVVGNTEDPPPPPATCVPGQDPQCDDEATTVLSSLPETGADGLGRNIAIGLGIAGLGALFLLVGRRRRSQHTA